MKKSLPKLDEFTNSYNKSWFELNVFPFQGTEYILQLHYYYPNRFSNEKKLKVASVKKIGSFSIVSNNDNLLHGRRLAGL